MVKLVEWFLSAKLPAEHVLILQMRLPLFDMHLMTKIRAQVQNLSFGKNGQTANNQRARAQRVWYRHKWVILNSFLFCLIFLILYKPSTEDKGVLQNSSSSRISLYLLINTLKFQLYKF